MKKLTRGLWSGLAVWCGVLLAMPSVFANIPGGGTGTGANVTLVNNGNGTVTMGNGIVSVLCNTSAAQITEINYTYNNGGSSTTRQLLNGGTDGGEFYWETGGFGSGSFTYTPVANTGNYAEMDLLSTSSTNGTMDVHFSMLKGSTGFYVTAIWSHRGVDAAMSMGETRDNIYAGAAFNWMSVDAARNRLMEVSGGSAVGVLGAPVEVSLWTDGIYQGQYEDKYKYSANFGDQRVWGWSSVGNGGLNVGLWNVSASMEYHAGGPTKRELMEHIGTTILNMLNSTHYGSGANDANWAAGEVWTKAYGPYFIYCNNVTNTITVTNAAAQALYNDALAQAAAEQPAWPYSWFTNGNYAPAANRGAVAGTLVINDVYNPNASAAGLWVGVVQQPSTTDGIYDFQEWMKTDQFWVKSDTNGNFTISNVVAGVNYTLYAFGPGAAGTFQSQAQTGGNSPNTYNLPETPFSVTVTAGATNNLGDVTWTPTRVGATVFEIGYPDRMGDKFRHGDDYWVGDIGPSPTAPSPIWAKHLEYPFDFPNGPNYAVGQSRWTTDWNFVQPIVVASSGDLNNSSSTITFNLPSAPAANASAGFYLALSSDFEGAIIIQVNGNYITSDTGYYANYSSSADESDTTIRQGIHGAFSDNRMNFAGSLLKAGENTITLSIRQVGGAYFADHAMYDYLRLELTGYVPPAPASVSAYPGNNCNLLSWPVTPGAASYNILCSTNSGSGYGSIATGVVGPVCGCGTNNATYLDTNALNGASYYYVVQSVNPVGASSNSVQSEGAMPLASLATNAPAAPDGLAATASHASVALSWNASAGASYYSVWRSTLVNTGGGTSNTLGTIILNNTNTTTSYTDTSPTDGSIYSYFVTATGAGGTSSGSAAVNVTPLPAPPASAPAGLTITTTETTTNEQPTLRWDAVSGAVGYIIFRSTSPTGPFVFPGEYVMSITETTYTDVVPLGAAYYYVVVAVNAAGVSGHSAVVGTPPGGPASLTAYPGNAQITLVWSAVAGATNYIIKRGLSSGDETTTVATTTNTIYTDSPLANGTTYFYVVIATGSSGNSPSSPEASATPSLTAGAGLVWIGSDSLAWDTTTTNWISESTGTPTTYADGNDVIFNNSGVSAAVFITSAVFPGSVTFTNSSVNYTIGAGGAGISGGAGVLKADTGTVTFTNANAYAGGLIISGGNVSLPGANGSAAFTGALGTGAVTINSGGELEFAPPGGGAGQTSSTFNNNFVLNGGLVYGNDGQEHLAGTIAVNSNSTLLRQWNNGTADQLKALLLDGVVSGSAALNLYGTGGYVSQGARIWIDNPGNTYGGAITVYAGTALTGYPAAAGGFSLGVGNNSALRFATVNLQGTQTSGGTDATEVYGLQFLGGVTTPVLGALEGNGIINLDTFGTVTPVALTVGGNNAGATFSGALTNTTGAGSLTKTGAGVFILTGADNGYSGGTTVNGGTLLVNNTNGRGTGAGAVTVAGGGALGGNGIISGAVTVNSGGVFAPGNPLGTLTLSNTLGLSPGSTTVMEVESSPLTNNAVKVSGNLTEGGTLNVTNIGALALADGDSFKLFNAGSYGGAFANMILPPLPAGLGWNTNGLNTSGVLSVVVTAEPVFGSVTLTTGGLSLSGSGGVADANFYLLAATNLAMPLTNWTRVLTNQFDAGGNFSFTNAINPNVPQTFYLLQLP
jgi:rhamnogalacturonan endolyase